LVSAQQPAVFVLFQDDVLIECAHMFKLSRI
jgi:hypothetical protein